MLRAIALTLLLSSRAFAYEMEDVTTINFELKDPKTGEVYYTGKEDITQDGKNSRRETVYYDAAKKEVEKEVVVYDRETLKVSAYEFKNELTGEESKMDVTGNEAKVVHRAGADAKAKDGTIKVNRNAYHGKVVNYLILRNWKALNSNKIFKFDLILPSRMETIAFQIVHRRSYVKDGDNREVFALIPQNILIRTLAPHLEFEFAATEKPIARQILAPSPLPINGQKDKMIYFSFSYPQFDKAKDPTPTAAPAAAPTK